MHRTRLGPCLVLLVSALLPAQKDPGTSYLFRIPGPLPAGLRQQLEQGFDVLPQPFGVTDLHVVILPEELARFRQLPLVSKLVERGRPYSEIVGTLPQDPDARYYTPLEVAQKLTLLATTYPQIAKRIDLSTLAGAARTHGGRSIYALKVSDNVGTDEDEPAVILAAEHHARELSTPVMVFGAAERILKGYATSPSLKAVVDGYELYFVPCVNPDGTDYVWTRDNWWRKNRRFNGGSSYGVDNNRNYPFLWSSSCSGSTYTSSQTYKGPSPGSEPENRTLMALSRMLRPEIYLDYHSYGREVLFTYAPCASVYTTIRGLINRYVTDLRTPMGYLARNPSAAGEAPEWHWADGGAMSFLTEVQSRTQGFQPSYILALAEEQRVWPGIQRALTTWRPAVRGHVRSIFKNQPLVAKITYSPNLFYHGEKSESRARDGRYAVWLPLGTYKLTYAVAGHVPVTRNVTVTSYDSPKTLEIQMVPTMAQASLTKLGTDRIGTTTNLTYTSPGDAGKSYWVLLSLGKAPGIPVGGNRLVPLVPDGILITSMTPNTLLTNNAGTLSSTGKAVVGFPIPNIPVLVNLTVYSCGITLDSNYAFSVKNFSQALAITLKP